MNDTRQSIIEAGIALFSKKGYSAVRTKEIATLAKVNETTLFRHFKGKRELFEQIIIQNVKAIDEDQLFHSKLTGDLSSDLVSIAKQLYMVYSSNAQILRMIMKSIIEDGDRLSGYASQCRGDHIREQMTQYFDGLVKSGTIADDPKLLTELFMSCINGYLLSTFILEDEKPEFDQLERMVQRLVTIIKTK